MQRLVQGVRHRVRTLLMIGVLAAAALAWAQAPAVAASSSAPGVAPASIQEVFFGFAEAASQGLAQRLAINDALAQAKEVGDTSCRVLFAFASPDPDLPGIWDGEAEISCLASTT
jgi:hypothetical protein